MSIEFQCLGCGKTLRVANEKAGQKGKCPHCGAIVTVPQPEPEPEVLEILPEPSEPPPGGARVEDARIPTGVLRKYRGRTRPGAKDVQVIEKTAKRWKGRMVVGALLLLVGLLVCALGVGAEESGMAVAGAIVSVVGVVIYLYACIAAWWHHG